MMGSGSTHALGSTQMGGQEAPEWAQGAPIPQIAPKWESGGNRTPDNTQMGVKEHLGGLGEHPYPRQHLKRVEEHPYPSKRLSPGSRQHLRHRNPTGRRFGGADADPLPTCSPPSRRAPVQHGTRAAARGTGAAAGERGSRGGLAQPGHPPGFRPRRHRHLRPGPSTRSHPAQRLGRRRGGHVGDPLPGSGGHRTAGCGPALGGTGGRHVSRVTDRGSPRPAGTRGTPGGLGGCSPVLGAFFSCQIVLWGVF